MKEPKKSREEKRKDRARRRHPKNYDTLLRIEELEKILAESGSDLDPETIVSMYMPRRRLKRLGAMLLSLDRMHLCLLGLLFALFIMFFFAFMQEKMGNFTINLNRLEMYRKGISIAADGDFTDPTARLTAGSLEDATNISLEDLPEDLDQIDGAHNGKNYVAYTYYLRNAGKEDVGYRASVRVSNCTKGAEEAVRVALWRNGERTIYAEPAKDGEPEENCVNFKDHNTVCEIVEENFQVGNVDKYTIVVWMEGEDPECVDAIIGGSVEFAMSIDALADDDTNLLVKFIQDIRDTLTGDKPIFAWGTTAPDYYQEGELTWKNRRNQ